MTPANTLNAGQPWSATTLLEGQWMSKFSNGFQLEISHMSHKANPYMADVLKDDVFLYCGAHPSLAAAKQACEQKAVIEQLRGQTINRAPKSLRSIATG